jgi:hypothetical protein
MGGGSVLNPKHAVLSLVADRAPVELLGTGFGIFNLMGGGAFMLVSILAWAYSDDYSDDQ